MPIVEPMALAVAAPVTNDGPMGRSGAPGPSRPAIDSADLLALLGDWSTGEPSLYQGLAAALRRLIERGEVAPGTRPPERVIAQSLAVSRGTVMNAFDALRQDSFLESRQGSGTRVRLDAPRPLLPDTDLLGEAASSRSLSGRLFDDRPEVVDLAVSMLHDADAVRSTLLPSSWEELEAAGNGHGYAPQGTRSLREAISGYYQDRGLRTAPEQLLVTAGAQQGIDLCAALALRPGDCVLVESPTYPGAIDAFARYGARVVSIPFESHWERRAELRDAIERYAPRIVYLMPGTHNPTGRSLPDSRRREIAHIADACELYVIEDNTLADVEFAPRDRPLIAAYSKQDRVLTLGSLSKSGWGGLRVGWIRGENALVARLARIKAAKDLGTSPITQLIAQHVLADFEHVTTSRREQLRARSDFLQQELRRAIPEWTFEAPEGGLSLWVRLPIGTADEYVQTALRHGVAVIPGSAHCVDGAGSDHIRVAYAQPESVIAEGVARLRSAWHAYARRHEQADAEVCRVVELRPRGELTG
jgi:DNA-binding transcriptional MocR family regulator